jgi:hypothetical protein
VFRSTRVFKNLIVVTGGLFLSASQIWAVSPIAKPMCEPPEIIFNGLPVSVETVSTEIWNLKSFRTPESVWVTGASSQDISTLRQKQPESLLAFDLRLKISSIDFSTAGGCTTFSKKIANLGDLESSPDT